MCLKWWAAFCRECIRRLNNKRQQRVRVRAPPVRFEDAKERMVPLKNEVVGKDLPLKELERRI